MILHCIYNNKLPFVSLRLNLVRDPGPVLKFCGASNLIRLTVELDGELIPVNTGVLLLLLGLLFVMV